MMLSNQTSEMSPLTLPELPEDLLASSVRDIDSACQVVDCYRAALWESTKALGFLKRLGIASPEIIDRFNIGFSARSLGKYLPPENTPEGEHIRGVLRQLGLLLWSGHELMRNAITVTEFDEEGDCCQIYGRRLSERQPAYTSREPTWCLNQPAFFNQKVLQECKSLVLCDNPLDMTILYSLGFSNVVATAGLNSFSSSHLSDLESSGVESVVIAYGNTPQENHSALLVSQALEAIGACASRLRLPPGLDIQKYVLNRGVEGLHAFVSSARPFHQTYESLLEAMRYD